MIRFGSVIHLFYRSADRRIVRPLCEGGRNRQMVNAVCSDDPQEVNCKRCARMSTAVQKVWPDWEDSQ